MSTSDPQDRPVPDEPLPPSDAPETPSELAETSSEPAETPSHESPAPADLPPSGEGVTVTDDTAHRHAQARPLPTPPEPEAERRTGSPRFAAARTDRPGLAPTTTAAATAHGTAGPHGPTVGVPTPAAPVSSTPAADRAATATPGPVVAAGTATEPGAPAPAAPLATPAAVGSRAPAEDDTTLFPDPNAPRTISAVTHVLGLVVGLLLPAVATLVTLLGVSRILSVEADGWAARVEVLGIVLVTLGALLLVAVALLSLWTPWVGYTGGVVLTLAGGLALYAPGVTRTAMLDVVSAEGWQPTVVQTSVAATSGTLLVIGVMVLASGIVSHVARRHGIHLGAFRERNAH